VRRNPVTLVFPTTKEAVAFLEALERLAGANISGELRMNKVKIYIHEQGERYSETLRRIQALYATTHGGTTHAVKSYNFETLMHIAGADTPIPPVLLEEILRLRGYKATLKRGGILETNADVETIGEYLRRLSEAYRALLHIPSSAQAKRVIALLSVYWEKGVDETIDILEEMGLIERRDRLEPRHNFKRSIEIALEKGY